MGRLIKYSDALLRSGSDLVRTASDAGDPEASCCCEGGSCPPGGLCPCPDSGVQPLFDSGWPGQLAIGAVAVYCEGECSYVAGSNGIFTCPGSEGDCPWAVSVCAQITCATIDEETGCGSDCSLTGITVTVVADDCDCPDELPDYSGFNYFYCP